MTCNFKNISGTDLDDLFYVNNSNAGVIGFKCTNGQDLGNRYPAGSISTNIGYKNSAGTDIGYLRAKLAIPQATAYIQKEQESISPPSKCTTIGYDSEVYTHYPFYQKYILRPVITITNSQPVTSVKYTIQICCSPASITRPVYYTVNTNSTNLPNFSISDCVLHGTKGSIQLSNTYKDLATYSSTNLNAPAGIGYGGDRNEYRNVDTISIRLKIDLTNSMGTSTIYTAPQNFNLR